MIFQVIGKKFRLRFTNRKIAGSILAEAIRDVINVKNQQSCSVLGIARGGVIVADMVARKLNCDLGVVLSKRICAPWDSELTIGAVMPDGTTYLHAQIIKELSITEAYIEKERVRKIKEVQKRASVYGVSHGLNPDRIRACILVDDGAASGATIITATKWLRERMPHVELFILAVPVVPRNTLTILKNEADHVVFLTSPSNSSFRSVEQYYQSFEAVEDNDVIEIVAKNRKLK
jgi:putative phosphoribosyl transferase